MLIRSLLLIPLCLVPLALGDGLGDNNPDKVRSVPARGIEISKEVRHRLLNDCGAFETEIKELKKKLERSRTTGKPLRVKLGIDPTGFDVHLGHTVVLRKLRQFQELGHTAVLIIGTATAAVGHPSGRDASRQGLTPEQIEKNAQTYLDQIKKVFDVSKVEVRPNGEWFSKFGFAEMLRLLGHTTVQRMIEREAHLLALRLAEASIKRRCQRLSQRICGGQNTGAG